MFIVYVLLIRQSSLPKFEFDWLIAADKIAHSVLFFVLILLLLAAFLFQTPQWFQTGKGVFLFGFISVFFGLITELLQLWITTDRSAEWADFLADVSGVLVGGAFFEMAMKMKRVKLKKM